jgi:DNA-binding LacI/PurR family transcriptional regulator
VGAGLTVGVLSPFVGGDYYGAIIAGVAGAVAGRDGRVLAIQTLDPGSRNADHSGVPEFHSQVGWGHVSGFVIVVGAVDRGYVDAILGAGLPVVLISHVMDGIDCPTVLPDNRAGVREAVEHLVGHSHRRIAFVGYRAVDDIQSASRGADALTRHGVDVDPGLVFDVGDNHESGGAEAAISWRRRACRRPPW